MYKRLDKALHNTRSSLLQVCAELGIDPSEVTPEELDNSCCCNCGIWGKNHTHEDGLPICHFCNDIDSLRF